MLVRSQRSLFSVTIQLAECDKEVIPINPALDVSLPPELTNATDIEKYLSNDDGKNKCS